MKNKKLLYILIPLVLLLLLAIVLVLVFTLKKDKMVDIQVDSTNIETAVDWGQDPDLSGLVVKVKYKSGKLKTLGADDYQVDLGEFDNQTAGDYTITITYKSFSKELTITVSQPDATQVILDTNSVKKTFDWGEEFSAQGLVVRAKYEDNTEKEVSADGYRVDSTAYDSKTPGSHEIKVYVGESYATYSVTVSQPKMTEVILETDDVQKVFGYGKDFNSDNLVVKAKYEDDSIKVVNAGDYTVDSSAYDSTKPGPQVITVKVGTLSNTYTVTVNEAQMTKVILDTEGVKKTFAWGEEFNHDKLKVQTEWEDGSVKDVEESDYKILNSYDAHVPGNYNVRVFVQNLSAFYTVTVQEASQEQYEPYITPKKITLNADNGDKIEITPVKGQTSYYAVYNKQATFTAEIETADGAILNWENGGTGSDTLYSSDEIRFVFVIRYSIYESSQYYIRLESVNYSYSTRVPRSIKINNHDYSINFGKTEETMILHTKETSITAQINGNYSGFSLKVNGSPEELNGGSHDITINKTDETMLEFIYNDFTYYTLHVKILEEAEISYISSNSWNWDKFIETDENQYYATLGYFFDINDVKVHFTEEEKYTYKIVKPDAPFKVKDNTFSINIYEKTDEDQSDPVKTVTVKFDLWLEYSDLDGFFATPNRNYYNTDLQKIVCYIFPEKEQLKYEGRIVTENNTNYVLQSGLNECYVRYNYKYNNEGDGTDFLVPAVLYNGLPVDKMTIDGKDYSFENKGESNDLYIDNIYVYGDKTIEKQISIEFDEDVFEVCLDIDREYNLHSSSPTSFIISENNNYNNIYVTPKDKNLRNQNGSSTVQQIRIYFQTVYVKISYQNDGKEYSLLPKESNRIEFNSEHAINTTFSDFKVELEEGYTYELRSCITGQTTDLKGWYYQSYGNGDEDSVNLIVKKDGKIVDTFEIELNFRTNDLNPWSEDKGGNFFHYVNKSDSTYTIENEKVKEVYVDGHLQADKTITLTDDVTKVDLVLVGDYGFKATLYIVKTEDGNKPPNDYINYLYLKHNGETIASDWRCNEYMTLFYIDMEDRSIDLSECELEVSIYDYKYQNYSSSYEFNGEDEFTIKIFDDQGKQVDTRLVKIVLGYGTFDSDTTIEWGMLDYVEMLLTGGDGWFISQYLNDNSSPINVTLNRMAMLVIGTRNYYASITFDSDEDLFPMLIEGEYGLSFSSLGEHKFTVTVLATDGETETTYAFNVTVVDTEPWVKVSYGDEYAEFMAVDTIRHLFIPNEIGATALFPINNRLDEFMQGKATLNFEFADGIILQDEEGHPITAGEHVVDLQHISAAEVSYEKSGMGYKFYVDISGISANTEVEKVPFIVMFDYESVIAEITVGNYSAKLSTFDNGMPGFDFAMGGAIFSNEGVQKNVVDEKTVYTVHLSITGEDIKVLDMNGEEIEDLSDIELTLTEDSEMMDGIPMLIGSIQIQQGDGEPQPVTMMFNDYLFNLLIALFAG